MKHTIEPIAYIKSPFTSKFGIPRQGGLSQVQAVIVFEETYRNTEALRGLEGFSHLWLIWGFSENLDKGWSPTVRPPRLGGNKRVGVFATRSPFRPNGLGLSSVKIEEIKTDPKLGPVIVVSGADLMDGTPILDVKPYLAYTDSHPDAAGGFVAGLSDRAVEVDCPPALLAPLSEEQRTALLGVLAHDPRPTYQNDPARVYGMAFGGLEVHFTVADGILHVINIE